MKAEFLTLRFISRRIVEKFYNFIEWFLDEHSENINLLRHSRVALVSSKSMLTILSVISLDSSVSSIEFTHLLPCTSRLFSWFYKVHIQACVMPGCAISHSSKRFLIASSTKNGKAESKFTLKFSFLEKLGAFFCMAYISSKYFFLGLLCGHVLQ